MLKIKSTLLLLISSSVIFAQSPKFFISLTESFAQQHLSSSFQGQNLSENPVNLYGFSEPRVSFLEEQAQLKAKFWFKRFLDPEQKLLIVDITGDFKVNFSLVFKENQLRFQNPKLQQLKIEKQPELEETFVPVFEEFFRQLVIWDDQEKIKNEYGWTVNKFDVSFQKKLVQIRLNDDKWESQTQQQTIFSIHEDSLNLILQKWNPDWRLDISPNEQSGKAGLIIQNKKQSQALALTPLLKNEEDQLLLFFQNVDSKDSPLDKLQIPLPFANTSQIPQVSQTFWQNDRLTLHFQ